MPLAGSNRREALRREQRGWEPPPALPLLLPPLPPHCDPGGASPYPIFLHTPPRDSPWTPEQAGWCFLREPDWWGGRAWGFGAFYFQEPPRPALESGPTHVTFLRYVGQMMRRDSLSTRHRRPVGEETEAAVPASVRAPRVAQACSVLLAESWSASRWRSSPSNTRPSAGRVPSCLKPLRALEPRVRTQRQDTSPAGEEGWGAPSPPPAPQTSQQAGPLESPLCS